MSEGLRQEKHSISRGYSIIATYTLYRMSLNFGDGNPKLTKAIRKLSAASTGNVRFITHAEEEMEDDGFDHNDVLTCLRKGTAYGPELQNAQLRANIVHRGLHIRVVVGDLTKSTRIGHCFNVSKL